MEIGDVTKWNEVNGDNTLRLTYNLNQNSLVWDVGAYHGEWAQRIFSMFNCTVHCFEPIRSNFNHSLLKFGRNRKMIWHDFGLNNFNGPIEIFEDKNCSSSHIEGGNREIVQMKDVIHFWNLEGKPVIDLVKLNIEGDEYNVLNRLIDYGIIDQFKEIQVQFHKIEGYDEKYTEIVSKLSNTHNRTYHYPWVWENWKLK